MAYYVSDQAKPPSEAATRPALPKKIPDFPEKTLDGGGEGE